MVSICPCPWALLGAEGTGAVPVGLQRGCLAGLQPVDVGQIFSLMKICCTVLTTQLCPSKP